MADSQTEEQVIDDTPEGQARRWVMEFQASRKQIENWHARGDLIIRRFLDERDESGSELDSKEATRLNLFTSNIQTIRAIMYGKTPKASVSRRFADAEDDIARVSAEMLERLLNADLERDGDSFTEAAGSCLDDRLLPGLGVMWFRYEVETEEVPGVEAMLHPETGVEIAPAVPPTQKKTDECVETDYIHWKDFLWSTGRTWREIRWVARRVQMSRASLKKKFPKDGQLVPLNSKQGAAAGSAVDSQKDTPWGRADVWEVWSKDDKKVYWLVEGFPRVLDTQDDELGLDGFYPCQRPMVANLTTSRFLPCPDYSLAQDIYTEIDLISNRITLLEKAIKVVGLYDKTAGDDIQRLLSEAGLNELIPAGNWPILAEKGGIAGVIQWLPLEPIVMALDKLREYRTELTQLLYQVTGMSDIVRGQAQTSTTATEQSIKAKFASVRLQAFQDEFARFCTDGQRIKAEIISKHFDPATIIERANIQFTADGHDQQMTMQAIELIKSDHFAYRIEVKPESISLTDYAALKQERTEVLQAIGGYLQVAGPLGQMAPALAPMLMQLLQWMMAGLKGSQEIEGILDRAIQAQAQAAQQASQQPQQQKQDPRLQTEQFKAQAAQQHTQMELQADLMRTHAETQASAQQEVTKAKIGLMADAAKQRSQVLKDIGNAVNPPGTTGGGG